MRHPLAPDPSDVRAGFERATRGIWTEPASYWMSDVFDEWLAATGTGDPNREMRVLTLHVGHAGWKWLDLDRAADLFQGGVWPQAWANRIDRPYRFNSIHPGVRLQMLANHIAFCTTTARDVRMMAVATVRSMYRLTLEAGFDTCPVEANFVAIHRAAIEGGDHSIVPPFFPGSSTSLRTVRR